MNATTSSIEVEAGGDAPTSADEAHGLQSLGELLAADESGETGNTTAGADEQSEGGSQEHAELKRFNDLAGRLDIELDALYGLEVTLDDDSEPATIEQLKDHFKSRSAFELERTQWEERHSAQQKELLRANQELQMILSELPKNAVKPETLERIRARHDAAVAAERQNTLKMIPQWQDADRRTEELTGIAQHLESYGIPPSYLEQMTNAAQLAYLRDNWLRQQRVERALAAVKPGKPAKQPTPTPGGKAPKRGTEAASHRPSRDPLADVFKSL